MNILGFAGDPRWQLCQKTKFQAGKLDPIPTTYTIGRWNRGTNKEESEE